MGEVSKNDLFGSSIIKIIKEHSVSSMLEIGSWDGTGSTSCIIEAMSEMSSKSLTCLEIDNVKFNDLVNNTSRYDWIKCFNESSISYESLIYKDFDKIWDSPFNNLPRHFNPKETVRGWFTRDVNNLKNTKIGFLERDKSFYEGVLIDGGEFTGYSEYSLVKDRTNFLFLDDFYHGFKTRQIAVELFQSSEWECLAHDKDTRNGFIIFKRINKSK